MEKFTNKFVSLIFMLLLSMGVYASDDTKSLLQTGVGLEHYGDIKYENINDVFENLTHRIILGTFGRKALLVFLPSDVPRSVIVEIEAMSEEDLAIKAKPFNYGLVNIALSALFFVSAIATSIMFVFMGWVAIERTIITSESGDFLGSKVDALKTNLKFFFILCLIVPVVGAGKLPGGNVNINISLIQYMTFKLIGISSYTGDKIFEIYASNTPTYYPIIEMPKTDGKYVDMINMIKYANCVNSEKIHNDINTVPFNFKRIGVEAYEAISGTTSCKLTIKIAFDKKTDDLIKNSEYIDDVVNMSSYLNIQYNLFKDVMRLLMKDADTVAGNIVGGNLYSNSITISPEQFSEKFVSCENIVGQTHTIESKYEATRYMHEAAKCMSERFIKNFARIPDMDYYQNNELMYDVEMCSNRIIDPIGSSKQQTEMISSEKVVNQKSIEDVSNTLSMVEYSQEKIEDCIVKYCSDFRSSSVYQCSNAIGLGYEHYSRKNMAKKGWMTSGAYIYKIFTNISTNENGRMPITSFSMNFNKQIFRDNITKLMDEHKIKETGPEIGDYLKQISFSQINIDKLEHDARVVSRFNNNVMQEMMKINSKKIGTDSNTLQADILKYITEDINRINICLKNPLEITNGISCGNVTTEISQMGNKILNISIYLKIGLLAAELKNSMEGNSGEVKGRKFEKFKTGLKTLGMLSMVTGDANGLDYILSLMGSDSFNSSFVGSNSFNQIIMASTTALSYYASQGNEKVLSTFNSFTWGLFFIGILFTFVIPLIPFTLWVMAVMGWLISVFQLLVNLPLWAATTISVSEEESAAAMKVGMRMMIGMLIKIPLMVIGLIIAWLLTNIFIQRILSEEMISFAINFGDSGLLFMVIDYLLILLIYVIMLITIYNTLFSLIEGFHELAMNWMGDKDGGGKLLGKEGGETTAVIRRFKDESSKLKGLKWKLRKK